MASIVSGQSNWYSILQLVIPGASIIAAVLLARWGWKKSMTSSLTVMRQSVQQQSERKASEDAFEMLVGHFDPYIRWYDLAINAMSLMQTRVVDESGNVVLGDTYERVRVKLDRLDDLFSDLPRESWELRRAARISLPLHAHVFDNTDAALLGMSVISSGLRPTANMFIHEDSDTREVAGGRIAPWLRSVQEWREFLVEIEGVAGNWLHDKEIPQGSIRFLKEDGGQWTMKDHPMPPWA